TQFAYGKQQLRVVGGAAACAAADPARLPKNCGFKDITLNVRAPDYRFDWMVAKVGTLGRVAKSRLPDSMESTAKESVEELFVRIPSDAKYVTPQIEFRSSVREPVFFDIWGVRGEDAEHVSRFMCDSVTADQQRPVIEVSELSRWDYMMVAAVPGKARLPMTSSTTKELLSFSGFARLKRVRLSSKP
ncbi:MAG: hypothetical protein AAFV29_25305, partial [Myxococcota bacterium]